MSLTETALSQMTNVLCSLWTDSGNMQCTCRQQCDTATRSTTSDNSLAWMSTYSLKRALVSYLQIITVFLRTVDNRSNTIRIQCSVSSVYKWAATENVLPATLEPSRNSSFVEASLTNFDIYSVVISWNARSWSLIKGAVCRWRNKRRHLAVYGLCSAKNCSALIFAFRL